MAIAASILLGPLFMLVLAVGIFNSIFYSVRPIRFKARPLASLVSFSGAVSLSFLSGVAVMGSVNLLNPVFLLLTDRKSTRLNSSHVAISYAVFCLKKKKKKQNIYNAVSR